MGGGDLHFLGKAYRKLHHLGEPRKRRPWFNKSWYISIEMLKNHMARIMGDEFGSAFDTLTERERGGEVYKYTWRPVIRGKTVRHSYNQG